MRLIYTEKPEFRCIIKIIRQSNDNSENIMPGMKHDEITLLPGQHVPLEILKEHFGLEIIE